MLKLRLLTGPRAGRQLRVSDTKPVSVGRRVGRLRLHDSRVSKQHASIAFTDGMWVLRDLGSANGTFVNRRRISSLVELETGDVVQMGRVLIKILQADAVGMVDPTRGQLGGTTGVGIDAFTASGATGVLPAIDPGSPIKEPPKNDDVDLASIFADDEDDVIDFSEQSRSDATRVAADPDAGKTQHDGGVVELDPIDDQELDDGDHSKHLETDAPNAADKDDPLLAGPVDLNEPIDDLVSIEDEPVDEKPQPGTTMLAALDDKPEVVGLRLDQAPPKQPVGPALDDEVEAVAGADLGDPRPAEDEQTPHADAVPHIDAPAAEAKALPEAGKHDVIDLADDLAKTPTPAVSPRASDASLTDLDDLGADGASPAFDLETAHAELVFEDVLDVEPAQVDTDAIAEELWPSDKESTLEASGPESERDIADPAEAETEPEFEAEPTADSQDKPDDVGGVAEQLSTDAEANKFDIDAAFDALSVGLDDSVQMPAIREDGAESVPPELEPQDEVEPEETLSEAQRSKTVETTDVEPEPAPAELAGSQVDISFIRDALARLGEDDAQAPAEPDADSRREQAVESSAPTRQDEQNNAPGSAAAVADELEQDEQIHQAAPEPGPAAFDNGHTTSIDTPAPLNQPPPGINPTSILPPTEPENSYRPRSKAKTKWFYSALALMIVFTLGGALAYSVFVNPPITGKDAGESNDGREPEQKNAPTSSEPTPSPTGTAITPSTPATPDPAVVPTLPDEQASLRDSAALAGSAGVPNPFADGPSIIGGEALAGMTIRNEPGVWLQTPTDRGPRPTEIIQPTLPGSNPGDAPGPTESPGATPPPETPASTPGPTPPARASIDTPARIVFLVDASGSLVDSLPQMIVWLNEAIDTIQPDERFTIIFFKASQAIEAEPAGLKQLTRDLRATLERDWLDPASVPVLPAGRSDPSEALELALAYEPTDLYLLSDASFARHAGDTTREQAITLVTKALGDADARVHGVQFFYEDEAGVLETLANRFDGTYEFVAEDIVPETDPIDLLEELEQDE